MTELSTYEAKTKLLEILRRVGQGEQFLITRHGVPIAQLSPVDSGRQMTNQEAIEALREFGKGRSLKGLDVKAMIEEGRR